MKTCSICGKITEKEDAPVLSISGYGTPRYLCDECAAEMDAAIGSKDPEEIETAIKVLGDKMNDTADDHAAAVMSGFIGLACDRLVKIKEGTYDFALDEKIAELQESSEFEEIPEELQETEEDRELDRQEEEKQKKFDKIMNWVSIIAIGLTAIYLLIMFLK